MKKVMAAAAVAALAACAPARQDVAVAPAPAQPAVVAFDPVGTWDVTADVQGTSIRGVLVIRRDDQGLLTGGLTTDVAGEIALQRITLEGRRAETRSPTPQGDMIMRFEFPEDDRLTGGFELATGVVGTLSGQRRRPPGS